ncbi:hypothetical protein [Kribbella sp. NPDC049584]|uniref:hypothetical protein n=1 Tax=Kribbella sp. NPDC049584 TaxID=3154833 RepID=UPI00341F13FC
MSIRRARALRRIDTILTADLRPEAAYPLRARLGRASLAAAEWLDEERRTLSAGDAAAIAAMIRTLKSTSRRIMQPSEPFDSVWQAQWHEVLELLTDLRRRMTQTA